MPLRPYQTVAPRSKGANVSKKMRILYVEDEDLNWEVTLLQLRERYDLERATNSKEAFEMLKSKTFHAVLMDIQLSDSDMDGTEITLAMRGRSKNELPDYAKDVIYPNLPIIFMTAYSARYSKADLLAIGGNELVTKPVDFTHLGLCLHRCIFQSA